MLEGLDEIDWASLQHAYGPATDVPIHLRALAFGDEETRRTANQELGTSIYHQGTVYEATASAVPFLIELFVAPESSCRFEAIGLLGIIARGESLSDTHGDLDMFRRALTSPEAVEHRALQMEADRGHLSAIRKAIAAGLTSYIRALEDPSPEIRGLATYVVAPFPEHASQIVPALWQTSVADPEPDVRASALLALTYLLGSAPSTLARFERLLDAQEPEVVRLAAATALTRLARAQTPKRAIELLCRSTLIRGHFNQLNRLASWTMDFGDPIECLTSVGPLLGDYATGLLVAGLSHTPSEYAKYALLCACRLHFSTNQFRALPPERLTGAQRALMAAVTYSDAIWAHAPDCGAYLRNYGLPTTRAGLWQYLLAADGVGMN